MRQQNPMRALSSAIVLIGLVLAFVIDPFNLPIFFVALAFSALVGSFSSGNPRAAYGGFYGFFWLLILALFFVTHSWLVFLIGAAISALLSAFFRPIMAGLLGMGILGAATMASRQPQQPYQAPYQPSQSYQQGYQPPPQPAETYQEGGQHHPYAQPQQAQYEQPQAQYPQEMPPQQQ